MSTTVSDHRSLARAPGLACSTACRRAAVLVAEVGSRGSMMRRQARVYDPITWEFGAVRRPGVRLAGGSAQYAVGEGAVDWHGPGKSCRTFRAGKHPETVPVPAVVHSTPDVRVGGISGRRGGFSQTDRGAEDRLNFDESDQEKASLACETGLRSNGPAERGRILGRTAGPLSTQTPWATVRNCPRRCSYRTRGRSA